MKHRGVKNPVAPASKRLRDLLKGDAASFAFVALAQIHLDQGESDEAIRLCREGIGHHPNHSSGHLVLGLAFEKEERSDEAIREFQEVVNLDPGNRLAVQKLGEAFRRGRKEGAAKKSGRPARPGGPGGVDLGREIAFFTFSMAEVYEKQGFFEKALAIYRRVLALQPRREDVVERIRELEEKTSVA